MVMGGVTRESYVTEKQNKNKNKNKSVRGQQNGVWVWKQPVSVQGSGNGWVYESFLIPENILESTHTLCFQLK